MSRPSRAAWWTIAVVAPAVIVYTTVLGVISLLSTLIDRRGRVAHGCAQLWSWLILRTARVRVERRGTLPTPGTSCVFVANHASFFDIPVIFTSLPGQLRIIAKAGLGRVPFIGWHLRLAGHLLVNRQKPGAGVFKKMQRMARHGVSLIVFPEGSRSRDGRVAKFKAGVFLLAVEAHLPIVPVSISGTRAVMPRGGLTVSAGDVRVIVHEPVMTDGLGRDDVRALASSVREIVAAGVNA